ncbi:NADPH-dependent F420 reductase [Peterkaempfera bronchialis]|uniref:NADPH-dependent F420 reductase n=1 Tax=Peterkaempfera bronchialis TaxID=2126346 RepID=UPI003C2DE1E6
MPHGAGEDHGPDQLAQHAYGPVTGFLLGERPAVPGRLRGECCGEAGQIALHAFRVRGLDGLALPPGVHHQRGRGAAAVGALPDWQGRIVVDATNQFTRLPPDTRIADLGDLTGSEYVASLLPGARVVKAFNTLYGPYIAADPRHPAGRRVLFYAGDDPDAKARVHRLADQFGFAPVDLGSLRDGGRLMQLGGPLSGLHLLKQD